MCRPGRPGLAAACFIAIVGCGVGPPPSPPTVARPDSTSPAPSPSNAASDNAPTAERSVPSVTTASAGKPELAPPTDLIPAVEIRAAITDARKLLEQQKYVTFFVNYAPVEDLRRLRRRNILDKVAAQFGAAPECQSLIELLKYLESQSPQISDDGGLATFAVTTDWRMLAAEERAAQDGAPDDGMPSVPAPEAMTPSEKSNEPVPGYSGDLASVLEQAARALQADDVGGFVANMFPIDEVRRLRPGNYGDVLQRLAENPDMKARMIADLQAAAKVNAAVDGTGAVASIALPGIDNNAPERTFRFERSEGHWRLPNTAGAIRETIAEQLQNQPPQLPEESREIEKWDFQMEWLGTQWRIIRLPDQLLRATSSGQQRTSVDTVAGRELEA